MKSGSCSATTVAGSAALPFVISTGGVMGLRPTQGDENGFCSATTLPGSAALPFVISTGGVMGLLPTASVRQPHSPEAPPSPLSSRPELRRSVVERSAVSAVLPWECFSTEWTAPYSPLSSRPKRSAVERSAVQRSFPGNVLLAEGCEGERPPISFTHTR